MKTEILKRNFLIFGAACASIGYIFSIASGSLGLVFFLFSWILNYKELNFGNIFNRKESYLLVLFFLLLCLGVLWSLNIKQGQKDIIRFLPFLFLPLIFISIKPFEKRERLLVVKIFVHSLSIFFIVCFINAMLRQIGFWGRGGIFNWYYFYRYDFLEIFDQHPTYLSMFTLLSLTFLLHSREKIIRIKWFFYATIALQTGAIFLYGSRMGYLLFGLFTVIYLYRNISSKSKSERLKRIIIYTVGSFIILFFLWNIPIIKERILYTFGYNYDYQFNNKEFLKDNKTPEEQGRLLLWQDALDLIKERPIFGYGTGSTRETLLQKYKEEGHTLFLENRFNAHNSYLESLLSGGIVLLISYLLIIIILFLNSFRKGDLVLLSFALIIAITSITETLFLAQGILFLSFFYCFFLTKINEE